MEPDEKLILFKEISERCFRAGFRMALMAFTSKSMDTIEDSATQAYEAWQRRYLADAPAESESKKEG